MAELTPAEQAVVGDVPDALVAELADAFWRIEGNYNLEGSGPGSRFDGQRLEFALALFAVRECSRALRPHIIIETLRNAEMTLAESGLRTVTGVRRWLRECADEIRGGPDAR